MAELSTIKEEFQMFLKFIQEMPEDLKSELCNLVYPFYVHIYVLFLQEHRYLEGQEFVSLFKHIFANCQDFTDEVKSLCELENIEQFQNHPHFKNFLECNFAVVLKDESLYHLREYFEEAQCKTLINIFRMNISVNRKSSYPIPEINVRCSSEVEISKFIEVLENFKEKLCPFTYIYKVAAEGQNLCNADINFENTQLVCAYKNRAIHLWDLTSNFLKVENILNEGENSSSKMELKYTSLAPNSYEEFLANDGKKLSLPHSDRLLSGHTGAVYGIDRSPNNELLLTCSEDGTIRTWNLIDFNTVSIYSGFFHPVWDIAVSPDGDYFASASKDARLWNFEYQEPLRVFEGHSDDVDFISFHPNSRILATASTDKLIKIWSTEEKCAIRTFFDNTTFQSSITFSPNGCHLASAGDNGYIKIFDVGSGQVLKEFQAHSRRILSISYNKQGTLLASGGFDKCLKVWDIESLGTNTLPKTVASYSLGETVQLVKFIKKDLLVSVI